MSSDRAADRVAFHLHAGDESPSGRPAPDAPFRIAVLGDFSGRGSRGAVESSDAIAARAPVMIDRDNLDDVMARIAPELRLALDAETGLALQVRFAELEDFHPDSLLRRVATFDSLNETKRLLRNASSFAETARALRVDSPPASDSAESIPAPVIPGNLLDQIVDGAAGAPTRSPPRDEFQAFLRNIVSPHVVPDANPEQEELIARVDEGMARHLRALLHAVEFQALEASWRAVFFLVRSVETSAQLQLHLFDISKAEIVRDLQSAEDLATTGLYRMLVEQSVETPGAEPWALFIGDYVFGGEDEDFAVLERIGTIAAAAGAPWVAGASARLVGAPSLDSGSDPSVWTAPVPDEWAALRGAPSARWIGLALPGFLLRLPYGRDTDECESIEFEEIEGQPAAGDFLWGNATYAAGLLLSESFGAEGWSLRPGSSSEIRGLPLYVYRDGNESVALPCARVLLTERAATRIMEAGVMPLASMKGGDAVRLVRFQSIAHPVAQLSGRWAM